MRSSEIAFQQELEHWDREIAMIDRLKTVNTQLHEYHWVFLHPYSQGMDIGILERLLKQGSEENVFNFFARKFLDLGFTIVMIDGFYKKRPYLKDYGDLIEQSVIACIQRNFAGAISVLIPVIEGTLRRYLVSKVGPGADKQTSIVHLLEAIKHLRKDYLTLQEKYMNNRYQYLILTNDFFTPTQLDEIFSKAETYFDLWMSQFEDYLKNNLYFDTRKGAVTDNLNRNVMFHGLDSNIEYSFRNYLRLVNCLNFLSWVLGVTHENCSVFAEVDDDEVKRKLIEYLRILAISETLAETKQKISGAKMEDFRPHLDKTYWSVIALAEYCVEPVFYATTVSKLQTKAGKLTGWQKFSFMFSIRLRLFLYRISRLTRKFRGP